MTLTRFSGNNHPQQVAKRGPRPDIDDRATTLEVFGPLNERFGFTIDVAAAVHNAKCERFFTIEDDGLAQPWCRESVWCNPPYSDIRPWVQKAWDEWTRCETPPRSIVMLLPANRTEQGWWQDLVEPHLRAGGLRAEFLRGRVRFLKPGATSIGPNERPPFGVVLLIWKIWSLPSFVVSDGRIEIDGSVIDR